MPSQVIRQPNRHQALNIAVAHYPMATFWGPLLSPSLRFHDVKCASAVRGLWPAGAGWPCLARTQCDVGQQPLAVNVEGTSMGSMSRLKDTGTMACKQASGPENPRVCHIAHGNFTYLGAMVGIKGLGFGVLFRFGRPQTLNSTWGWGGLL